MFSQHIDLEDILARVESDIPEEGGIICLSLYIARSFNDPCLVIHDGVIIVHDDKLETGLLQLISPIEVKALWIESELVTVLRID